MSDSKKIQRELDEFMDYAESLESWELKFLEEVQCSMVMRIGPSEWHAAILHLLWSRLVL